ncbi:MAG: hypothetical protein J6N72_02300, partial [Psychrobacter sp.]|nr:hypothetical protein [Psychrobacter sp.]
MPDSNNQFFLVNLSISIECFDKSLLGLYCTSSSTEAKILAIQGECHNIDHEDDEDVQHWYEKISDSVKNDHSVEDDDFCYSITSCRALTITEAMIDNQKVMLA